MKSIFIFISIIFISFEAGAQDGQYVETNGVKIYYEIHGEGEPFLLLHGFSGTHNTWQPWIKELSEKYKLIIPDLRGHGNSTNPSNIFTHKLAAIDMFGLMDHLGIEQFRAIGISSGGMTLTHMATMNTSRLTSLILDSSTSYFTDQDRAIKRGYTYEMAPSRIKENHPRGEQQLRQLFEQFKSLAENYDDVNFTPPLLSTIKSPTLIIHGDRDAFFPIDIPVIAYKAIPNSYLWVIPNGGHAPLFNPIWSDMLPKVIEQFHSGEWEK